MVTNSTSTVKISSFQLILIAVLFGIMGFLMIIMTCIGFGIACYYDPNHNPFKKVNHHITQDQEIERLQGSPTPPPSDLVDKVSISPTEEITFIIPISSPEWNNCKKDLPKFSFDPTVWTNLSKTLSRRDLEIQIHDQLASSFLALLRQIQVKNAPLISEIAQAGYLANQPNATVEQKSAYNEVRVKNDPIIEADNRKIQAFKILIKSLEQDIGLKPGYQSDINGNMSPKPANRP